MSTFRTKAEAKCAEPSMLIAGKARVIPGHIPAHPPFNDMVTSSIISLKERNGSSRQAIMKYIKANFSVGESCVTQVRLSLKRLVETKKLLQVKGTRASGSFKINMKDAELKENETVELKGKKKIKAIEKDASLSKELPAELKPATIEIVLIPAESKIPEKLASKPKIKTTKSK